MAKAPAFPFYASDFLTDTNSWDAIEVGIYIRLLATQWVNGFLVNDEERLARIAGVNIDVFKKAWVIVGFKFGLANDTNLKNQKLEEIRSRRDAFIEKQAANGKKGGRPSKNNPKETNENPTLYSGLTQNINQKKPLENEIEKEIENDKPFFEEGSGETFFPVDEFTIKKFLVPAMLNDWMKLQPDYAKDETNDYRALGDICKFIQRREGINSDPEADSEEGQRIMGAWSLIAAHVTEHSFFCRYSLKQVANNFQSVIQDMIAKSKPVQAKAGKEQGTYDAALDAKNLLRNQYTG